MRARRAEVKLSDHRERTERRHATHWLGGPATLGHEDLDNSFLSFSGSSSWEEIVKKNKKSLSREIPKTCNIDTSRAK